MILKAHHCFTDGLGLSAFCLALSDGYDANNLPQIQPPHWAIELLMVIMKPFLLVKGLTILARKEDNIHCFKHEEASTLGIKTGAFSMDLDINEIKHLCKKK